MRYVLLHFGMDISGSLADLKIKLEAAIKTRFPKITNPADFDFSETLETIQKNSVVEESNKSEAGAIIKKISDLESVCLRLIIKIDENTKRLDTCEKPILEIFKKNSVLTQNVASNISDTFEKENKREKSVDLPTFWKREPELWFKAAESIF